MGNVKLYPKKSTIYYVIITIIINVSGSVRRGSSEIHFTNYFHMCSFNLFHSFFFFLSLSFFFYLFPVRELYFIVHRHGLEGMDYSERKQAYRVSLPGRHLAFFRVFLDFVYASSQTSRFAVKHCKYCDLTRVYQAGHVLQSIVDDDLFFINITSPYLSLSCLYILCTCNKFT